MRMALWFRAHSALTIASGVQPITVTGIALPDGTATTSYSQILEAEDGQPPYTWVVLGGALPPGLGLNSAGTISGTPTTPGLATFTARATDSAGGFAAGVFTIMVDPAPLQVSAATLPNAMAGLPYGPQLVNATGGVPPYTFAITQGSLPAPLTFTSGQINSGVPTVTGSSGFTVTATDSTGDTASQAFTLAVEAAQPDLILSQGSVSFSIAANPSVLPPTANVTVGSSVTQSFELHRPGYIPGSLAGRYARREHARSDRYRPRSGQRAATRGRQLSRRPLRWRACLSPAPRHRIRSRWPWR